MVFVALGSQKFQFNRLLEKIDELVFDGKIQENVYAQIGYSDYLPKHYNYCEFLDHAQFEEKLNTASLVITHGGTGTIISAVKQGVKVIAVPRLSEYGEHVNDHQKQIVSQFDDLGLILGCYDMSTLGECYTKAKVTSFRRYTSSTDRIISSIDEYLIAESHITERSAEFA